MDLKAINSKQKLNPNTAVNTQGVYSSVRSTESTVSADAPPTKATYSELSRSAKALGISTVRRCLMVFKAGCENGSPGIAALIIAIVLSGLIRRVGGGGAGQGAAAAQR